MRDPSYVGDFRARRLALRRHKLFATGLLIIAAVVLVGARLLSEPSFVGRLIAAAAEAAIIGGLADWFAVTALSEDPSGCRSRIPLSSRLTRTISADRSAALSETNSSTLNC
jgi:uncharacterized membrane-anchored protein YjiN (DUF445 family)